MKGKSDCEDVNELIAKPKTVTVKKQNHTCQIRCYWLPAPACCYKSGKMVKCCLILCKKFTRGKSDLEGSGILATEAKVSLQTNGLTTQLLKIKTNMNV